MSKLAVYLGIMGTILLGLHIMGIIENTGTSTLLNLLLDPSQLFSLSFYLNLTNGIALLAGAAVTIGLFLQGRLDQAALIAFTGTMLLIGWDILVLFNLLKNINSDFALLIISPMFILYTLTTLEWWRGQS